ncbi:MAG TPA: type IV secretory system conjugative DNA transfer family protein [Bryobacteraceae bacterium]|nr:type IV secretory system conjugative DNA transfer family protein [Bryobacteraceae bacterium]
MLVVLVLVLLTLIRLADHAARKKRMRRAYHFRPEPVLGSARYATEKDCRKRGLFRGKGVRIGYGPRGRRALYYPGFGHILTIAAARMGKGATLICNALLSWRYSALVIDPKAENAAVTGHYRRRFGKVYVLNPFGILADSLKGLKVGRLNPMAVLDVGSRSFHASCDKLAAALVWDEGRDGLHFTTAARMLVSGVIAAVMRYGAEGEQNLVTVARIISGPHFFGFCRRVVQSTTDPFIVQKLGRFAAQGAENIREVVDVVSTAITQLGFIGNAAIADCLSGSDFRFSDLARKAGTTVFICLPLNMLDVCDKFFRLILETALMDLLSEGRRGMRRRVLAVIDEMAQLGPQMKSLENAMGMAAGAAGLQLWCVLQDLSQLKGMFPQTWETFIQNCGATLWFGARDQTTRTYVSALAGTREVVSRSHGVTIDRMTGEPVVSDSMAQHAVPLLLPEEVGALATDEMIAFVEGVNGVIRAKRKFYFRCSEFRGKYRANPYMKRAGGWLKSLFAR